MGWFSASDGDGGFLWLVGSILGAVDDSFDYSKSVMGTYAGDGKGKNEYVEPRYNHKGERNHIAIVETPFRDWNESVGRANRDEIYNLDSHYDQGRGPGGFFW